LKKLIPLALPPIPLGFGRSDQLFPLQVGNQWTYNVKTALPEFISKVTVARRIPVAGVEGYELTSTMGTSRLVWKDKVLYATVLSGSRFNPPLPLLRDTEEKHSFRQKLRMYASGKTYEVDATVDQETQPYTRGGKRFRATVTMTTLRLKDREIEIRSVYSPGTGLMEQVQRTRNLGADGGRTQFDLQMDYLSGP